MYKNVSGQKIAVYAYDTATGAPVTGDAANITGKLSKDGASQASTNDTNPSEIGDGEYVFDMTQAETSADLLVLTVSSATPNVRIEPVHIYTRPGTSSVTPSNVTQWSGSSVASPDTAGYPKVTIKNGTGSGEIAITSGVANADIQSVTGTAVTSVDDFKAQVRIRKNVAYPNFTFPMVLSSDGRSAALIKTVSGTRKIDSGAFASLANSVSEIANGLYVVNLDASDLNGDVITLRFAANDCDDRYIQITTQE